MRCAGGGPHASRLAFSSEVTASARGATPTFAPIGASSIVFGPHDHTDNLGTEDPRVVFEGTSGIFWMFYTCYNDGQRASTPAVFLCLASSTDPTRADRWTRHGDVGFGAGSKSAALLLAPSPPSPSPAPSPSPSLSARSPARPADRWPPRLHHLYWGSGTLRVTTSTNVTHWPERGRVLLNRTAWGNDRVEAGPPPLRLSSGDVLLLFNSWSSTTIPGPPGYEPGWLILDRDDPTTVVAQAEKPLFDPSAAPWMVGERPFTCNVRNVAFVEAAQPTDQPDVFNIYFGGADAVVGTATIRVSL